MQARTIKQVLKALGNHPNLELVKGSGYLYFIFDDLAATQRYETENVNVCYLYHLTVEQWVEIGQAFIAKMEALLPPVGPARYTIGRSKCNTVKLEPNSDGYVLVTLTESGGQYRQWCNGLPEVFEYLGRMWGFTALASMPEAEQAAKVRAKLRHVTGADILNPSEV